MGVKIHPRKALAFVWIVAFIGALTGGLKWLMSEMGTDDGHWVYSCSMRFAFCVAHGDLEWQR